MHTHISEVVRRSSRELFRHLKRANDGHRRAIHRARVASRRLREALPVAPGSRHSRRRDNAIRDIRRIGRALGPVRELDVAIREFEDDDRRLSFDPPAVACLFGHLNELRAERMHVLSHKMQRIDLGQVADDIDSLASSSEKSRALAWQARLSVSMRKRATRLASELRAAGTLYAPEPIHNVRIAGKKLRYTLELAQSAAGLHVGKEIATLKRMQKLLGRLHDLQSLQQYAREAAAATDQADVAGGLDRMNREFERECRELHGRFLAKVARCAEVAERARTEIPSLLRVGKIGRGLKSGAPDLRVIGGARTA
jgi:CHAD domain-containing protein